MDVRVVLVGTEYPSNLGAVCRVMKNFGRTELVLVAPRCDARSVDAYKGAKHAKDVLEAAKTVRTLADARKGCDFLIGTSGIKVRNKGTIRGVLPLREFVANLGKYKKSKIAVVFGREGVGLTEDEINECDILLHVEASEGYPVLNISHAAAVVLYSVSNFRGKQGERCADRKEMDALRGMFDSISSKFERRNMRAPVAFRRVIGRAHVNEHEAKALLNLFRMVDEALGKSENKTAQGFDRCAKALPRITANCRQQATCLHAPKHI